MPIFAPVTSEQLLNVTVQPLSFVLAFSQAFARATNLPDHDNYGNDDDDASNMPEDAVVRVLVVSDQYAPMVGGVPTVTRTLAHGLAERGHLVRLLVPSPGRRARPATDRAAADRAAADRAAAEVGADDQVTVAFRRSVPWPWYDGMRLAWLSRAAARKLITGFAPDVIHIHSPLTLGRAARRAGRRLGIPVVYTNHYLPQNARPARHRRSRAFDAGFYAYLVWFGNNSAHVTAPTSTALGLLRDRGLRIPSTVISNGIDLSTYCPGPASDQVRDRCGLRADCPIILAVGRLSQEKAIDVLLEAAARLAQDAQIAIAGTGPDEGRLREQAQRLGLGADRVRFLGFVPGPELPAVYRLADVFAIPSVAELQSLTTMEAMATGLPVVAANAYALTELVASGRNGFLVTPGRPDELAACLDALLKEPNLRARMAAESLRVISEHELSRSLAQWESLYGTLAAAGSR
jgi:glycosyltransferase involved in cell wall biosynthesis